MPEDPRLYAAVEAGGTKFVCAIGTGDGRILAEQRLPTEGPAQTIDAVLRWICGQSAALGSISGIGVASFGPLELRREAAQYGRILRTPKEGWSGFDLLGVIEGEFGCPAGLDTDVNAAAIAEHRWGAARDVEDLAYVTVGTGIGAGVLLGGRPLHGLLHPEIGHMFPRRHPSDPDFRGVCPFHGDCLEGLASGPAILARSGAQMQALAVEHPLWEIEADYLGQLCAQLVLSVAPRRILIGGGVMQHARLLPPIRSRMRHWLGGYIDREELHDGIDRFLIAPQLGARAGVLGALALAIDAAGSS